MKNNIIKFIGIIIVATFWASCSKDEKTVAPPEPDNEIITTVKLVATNANNPSDVQTAIWKDLSPDDTTPPDLSHAILILNANTHYNVSVEFWDETKSPAEEITTEVRDRSNYHLICFTTASGLNLEITRTDHDNNTPPLPVGLKNDFAAGAASSGNLEVELRHQPNVKDGTCSPGSTDADVNFQVNIQ